MENLAAWADLIEEGDGIEPGFRDPKDVRFPQDGIRRVLQKNPVAWRPVDIDQIPVVVVIADL